MRNTIIAGIRTGVQRLVAIGLGALGAWTAAKGFDIDFSGLELWLLGAIDVVLTAAVTSALNWLEKRMSWITSLMSLGQATSAPEYEKSNPAISQST